MFQFGTYFLRLPSVPLEKMFRYFPRVISFPSSRPSWYPSSYSRLISAMIPDLGRLPSSVAITQCFLLWISIFVFTTHGKSFLYLLESTLYHFHERSCEQIWRNFPGLELFLATVQVTSEGFRCSGGSCLLKIELIFSYFPEEYFCETVRRLWSIRVKLLYFNSLSKMNESTMSEYMIVTEFFEFSDAHSDFDFQRLLLFQRHIYCLVSWITSHHSRYKHLTTSKFHHFIHVLKVHKNGFKNLHH